MVESHHRDAQKFNFNDRLNQNSSSVASGPALVSDSEQPRIQDRADFSSRYYQWEATGGVPLERMRELDNQHRERKKGEFPISLGLHNNYSLQILSNNQKQ